MSVVETPLMSPSRLTRPGNSKAALCHPICALGELRPLGARSDCDDDCMSRTSPNNIEEKRLQHPCQ